MGSSSSTQDWSQPASPSPPSNLIPPQGQTSPTNTSSWINFLGDPSKPSTGLTPEMLTQIDSRSYLPSTPPAAAGLRDQLAAVKSQPKQRQSQGDRQRRGGAEPH